MGRRSHTTRDDMADDKHTLKTTQPRGSSKEILLCAKQERKRRRSEDEMVRSLISVRKEQATLYDPRTRSFCCCRGDQKYSQEPIAVFDHEEESTDWIARPLDTIPESRRDFLELALGVLYVKVLASDVGFPISVFGTILMRDDLDFKCIYLFKRGRDNCQIISSPGEIIMLTGPNRGPIEAEIFYFEINLKIKGDEETMDRIFSRTVWCEEYPLDQWTKKRLVSSWLSTLELAYRSVHYAVEATIGIKIIRGPREFHGSLTACSTEESTEMVLYDSERWGASAADEDGLVALPRSLVIIREDEDLILNICVVGRGDKSKVKTVVRTVEHSDKSFNIKRGRYQLLITISWSGILR